MNVITNKTSVLTGVFLTFFFSLPLLASERILSFDVQVVVNRDASLTVTEEIVMNSEGHAIKRGIQRDFPTTYRDARDNVYRVNFEVQQVLHNGKSTHYSVADYMNGKRIRIGDLSVILKPGIHTYTITYQTNRQLGFFEDHDELYWNAIGTGWDFAIDEATVSVTLPDNVLSDAITAEAYTGAQGKQSKNYRVHKEGNQITFETTAPLDPHEGMTIVVGWPKGIVTPPSFWMKFWWWMRDNLHRFIMLLAILLSILYYWLVLRRLSHAVKIGTIIPLFYPPKNLSAGSVRYLLKKKYEGKSFAAEIVQMAVKGYLAIELKKSGFSIFSRDSYTLKKRVAEDVVEPFFKPIFRILFAAESIDITPQNQQKIEAAQHQLNKQYDATLKDPYIRFNMHYLVGGIILAVLLGIGSFALGPYTDLYLILGAFILLVINLVCAAWLPRYTQDGQQLVEEVEGFKLFLATTETERLKIIGTPPDRTPELYETYLPYAIALDVEEQWSAQFASIFDRLAQAGHPYVPVWYIGTGPFTPTFGSQLGSSMNQAIASSVPIAASRTPPGSSSGRGGGGYSGGGGGGGGGRGW